MSATQIDQPVRPFTPAELAEAKRGAIQLRRSVIDCLREKCGDDASEFLHRVALTLKLGRLDLSALRLCELDEARWSYAELRDSRAGIVCRDGRSLALVVDPFDVAQQLRMEARAGASLPLHLVDADDFAVWAAELEAKVRATAVSVAGESETPEVSKGERLSTLVDISIDSIAGDISPIVRLVNATLYDALKAGASDIHLETEVRGLSIKLRIDGVLNPLTHLAGAGVAEQVVSRVKVMAELDISERRVPQDGRFKLGIQGRQIDFRVSIMPSLFGEDVVIRILDKQALTDQFQSLRLDCLGFDADTLAQIRLLATQPYGMFLVTGPTGSGKTTTLYAALSEIHTGEDKIVTIEDPIEYQLPGILQIPVNEKKGLTFARGLRSILRHDPDKILVGEIRDTETAQIAIQSALTGHLVFTSVHANNVFDVIGRFLHMGVDPYSFVSCLNGVMGQRLVRLVCSECAQPDRVEIDRLQASGITLERAATMRFVRGAGCPHCRGTGYKGRVAIGEVLLLNDSLREMIAARASITVIKEAAQARGTRFLRESAVGLLAQGRTTLDEINRVTFAI